MVCMYNSEKKALKLACWKGLFPSPKGCGNFVLDCRNFDFRLHCHYVLQLVSRMSIWFMALKVILLILFSKDIILHGIWFFGRKQTSGNIHIQTRTTVIWETSWTCRKSNSRSKDNNLRVILKTIWSFSC